MENMMYNIKVDIMESITEGMMKSVAVITIADMMEMWEKPIKDMI